MKQGFLSICLFVQVSEVRRSTRLEKKKLAMAMREKQLGALGMEVCDFSGSTHWTE